MSHPDRWPVGVVLALAVSILAIHPPGAARPQTGSVTESMPGEAVELHAKVIASVPPSARQWIQEQAKRVARTPGAENSPAFLDSVKAQAGRVTDGDVMGLEFAIFKEAIDDMNADKQYYLQRLSEANQISQALSDYLKYLTDVSGQLSGKDDSGGLCDQGRTETRKGMKDLRALQSRVPSGPAPAIQEPATIGTLKAAIKVAAADLTSRGAWLKKSIQTDSGGLRVAEARASELYPKMMETMKKVPRARYMRKVPPIK